MKRVILFRTDGSEIALPMVPTLDDMQRMIGGYVERVRCLDRFENGRPVFSSMFVHETGLIDGMPRNQKATVIYQRNIKAAFPNDPEPFLTAHAAFLSDAEKLGVTVIAGEGPGSSEEYIRDPYICGPAIWFEGYTCEEADEEIVVGRQEHGTFKEMGV